MVYLYWITAILFIISIISSREKTKKALKIAWKKFIKILPAFIKMLIGVSIILYHLPDAVIVKYLGGQDIYTGTIIGSLLGSITMMPGFIAFPLSGILLKKGVSYMVLAAFSTTLMMVGIITFPIEKKYFGIKLTVTRNVISYLIALVIAVIVGVLYGEVII